MFADADTIVNTLTTNFYHVLKNKQIYYTLITTLEDANLNLLI